MRCKTSIGGLRRCSRVWNEDILIEASRVWNEDILIEAVRMKWQDAKMSNLKYYIAIINASILAPLQSKMTKCTQSYLTTPMSLSFWRALTLL